MYNAGISSNPMRTNNLPLPYRLCSCANPNETKQATHAYPPGTVLYTATSSCIHNTGVSINGSPSKNHFKLPLSKSKTSTVPAVSHTYIPPVICSQRVEICQVNEPV